jgi:hypothetical protein
MIKPGTDADGIAVTTLSPNDEKRQNADKAPMTKELQDVAHDYRPSHHWRRGGQLVAPHT